MYPVNGTTGMRPEDFFRGIGCIPLEISRKGYLGSMVAEDRREGKLVRFLDQHPPVTEGASMKFLDRLEEIDKAPTGMAFLMAVRGLLVILEAMGLSSSFRASALLAVYISESEPGPSARLFESEGGIKVMERVVFRSAEDWSKGGSGKGPNMETLNRLRANLVYVLANMVSQGQGREILRSRDRFDRIASLVDQEHVGVVGNSLFFMRMAIERDRRYRSRCSPHIESIRKRCWDSDPGIVEEAEDLMEMLGGPNNDTKKERMLLDRESFMEIHDFCTGAMV